MLVTANLCASIQLIISSPFHKSWPLLSLISLSLLLSNSPIVKVDYSEYSFYFKIDLSRDNFRVNLTTVQDIIFSFARGHADTLICL